MSLFSGVKVWVSVIAAAVLLAMKAWIEILKAKNENLESENEALHREKIIDNIIDKVAVEADEAEAEAKEKFDDSKWRDHI